MWIRIGETDQIRKADQMSEAPERIWAHWGGRDCLVAFNAPSESYNTAYVRADLYDAQTRVIEEAKETLTRIAKWREECHDHDRDMGHEPRAFDDEDWKLVEYAANSTIAALDRQCPVCGGWVYVGDACCPKCSPEALAALQENTDDARS